MQEPGHPVHRIYCLRRSRRLIALAAGHFEKGTPIQDKLTIARVATRPGSELKRSHDEREGWFPSPSGSLRSYQSG